MLILLQKLGCFFGALLLIKLAFVVFCGDKFIYPKASPGNNYELEYRRVEIAKEPYDTVFIGSSRTALGVSPSYFDALTKETKSYNFGIISGKPPHTFDWCAELMQTKPSLKNVFFELSGGLSEDEKIDDTWVLTFFKPSVPRKEPDYENIFRGFRLPLQNIPLEKFLEGKPVIIPSKNLSLEKIRLMRLRNERFAREINTVTDARTPVNEEYRKRVSELIELAEAKRIRLYFFIPPRLQTDAELELIRPIYQKLDEKYKLKAAHDDEFLYRPEASLDNTHLNSPGSKKFTESIAEAFNKEKL